MDFEGGEPRATRGSGGGGGGGWRRLRGWARVRVSAGSAGLSRAPGRRLIKASAGGVLAEYGP